MAPSRTKTTAQAGYVSVWPGVNTYLLPATLFADVMRRRQSIVTKRATCPDCGATVTWREQKGIRRFQARIKRCQECGNVFR